MKKLCLFLIPLAAACASSEQPGEQPVREGTCLQLEVVVGDGFKVDGEAKALDEVGEALTGALASGNRTAAVDVSCGEGVTMASIRQLHEVMTARELYRIQYFREPAPPIPLMLPSPEMDAHLTGLPAEARCIVVIAPDGRALMEGEKFSAEAVVARLSARPDVIFVIAATDDVNYADFARVLGEVTGAGAERVSVQLVAG